jgi:acyl-CoA reductase-like NAD-dependent aldehyde dehydrogenase
VVGLQLAAIALDAGAPSEAVQVVTGDAPQALRLVTDHRVGAVSFTGGAVAGASLWRAAPFKRMIMELGGNSANLVLSDADVDAAAAACFRGAFSNSGQSCNSVQRLIVHRDVADDLVSSLAALIPELRVGDPFDETTDVAGMSSVTAAERVASMIDEAVADGARLAAGGKREGARVWPTLLDDVAPSMRVAREEIFGPVAVVLRVDDDDEAVRVANDTEYGLQFGVFTASLEQALACSERLEAGSVIINRSSNYRLDSFLYGGVKASGVGREDPASSVLAMSEEHFVVFGDRALGPPLPPGA